MMPVVHHIFANRSNAGDWLSAQGIQRLLHGVKVEEHLCDAPFVDETMSRLGKSSPEEVVIIGGGGLFSDYFTPFWKRLLESGMGNPLVLWGVGCCDRKLGSSMPDAAIIREVVRISSCCIVRDELTRDFLGPDGDSVQVVPCPTMVALAGHRCNGNAILHVDHFDNIGEDNFYAIKACCDEFARNKGIKSLWTNNIIPAGQSGKLDATVDLYGSSRLVVSSRLHGCIIGLSLGCKVLAISGDRKVESFMSAAGLSDWVIDIGDLSRLPEQLERLQDQPSAAEFVSRVQSRNKSIAASVLSIIHGGEPLT